MKKVVCFTLIFLVTIFIASPVIASSLKKVEMGYGLQNYCVDQVGPTVYVKEKKLFEKYAKQLGYDLTVNYYEYPNGALVNEAFITNKIQMGQVGICPTVVGISRGLPYYLMGDAEDHLVSWLNVATGSPIRSLDDIVKKKGTIGCFIGTETEWFLLVAFKLHYGRTPAELGVRLANITPADTHTFPKGVDAVATWGPAAMNMIHVNKTGVPLFDTDGITGPQHILGPGKQLPGLKYSWAYPEGYHASRGALQVRIDLAEKHPDLITAFLLAYQEAVRFLHNRHEVAAELSNKYWKLPSTQLAEELLSRGLHYWGRDWVWFTEAEAAAHYYTGKFLYESRTIKEPVTWEMIKARVEPIIPAVKKAYELSGNYPSASEFTKPSKDVRGLPTWEINKWDLKKWDERLNKQNDYIMSLSKKPISEIIK